MMATFLEDLTAKGETRHWLSRNFYLHVRLIFLSQWKAGAWQRKENECWVTVSGLQQLQTPGVDFSWELEELKMSYKIQRAEIKWIQEAHIEWDVELNGDLMVLIGIQIQMQLRGSFCQLHWPYKWYPKLKVCRSSGTFPCLVLSASCP